MKRLIFIALLTLLAGFIVWPQKPGNYIPGGDVLPGNPGILSQNGDFLVTDTGSIVNAVTLATVFTPAGSRARLSGSLSR